MYLRCELRLQNCGQSYARLTISFARCCANQNSQSSQNLWDVRMQMQNGKLGTRQGGFTDSDTQLPTFVTFTLTVTFTLNNNSLSTIPAPHGGLSHFTIYTLVPAPHMLCALFAPAPLHCSATDHMLCTPFCNRPTTHVYILWLNTFLLLVRSGRHNLLQKGLHFAQLRLVFAHQG